MIIAFFIVSIVAVIFLVIGISSRKSKTAVGFFTFVKPPKVEQVQLYNKAVSRLWFVAAGVIEAIGILLMFIEQNSPLAFLPVVLVFILVIAMMVVYIKIEAKYK